MKSRGVANAPMMDGGGENKCCEGAPFTAPLPNGHAAIGEKKEGAEADEEAAVEPAAECPLTGVCVESFADVASCLR